MTAKSVKPGITRHTRADGGHFYVARIRIPGQSEARKRFSRVRDAEQWLAAQRQRKERLNAGLEKAEPKRATRTLGSVASEVDQWITSRSDISVRTRLDYLEIARNLLSDFGDLQAVEVTAADVHAWVRTDLYGRGLSQQRVKKAVTVVGAMFGMLEASDLVDTNPVSKAKARWPGLLKPPTDQVRNVEVKEPLSMASLMHLSASAAEPYSTALMLMAHTGIRVGELLALEPKHVDLLRSTLTVEQALSRVGRMDDRTLLAGMRLSSTKSGKARQVPLNREACARLRTYLGTRRADDRFLFGAGSLPLDYWRLRGAFDKASASAGLSGYGLHDIRKAFATALIAEGLDVKSVGALLGHSPSSVQAVTMTIYAQPSTSRAAAAVESLSQAMNQ